MAFEVFWSILFGLVGSCTLNLGKAIQKQGIELFQKKEMEGTKRAKKGFIWIIGSVFSFIQPLFQLLGTEILGENATIYSAMMGVGIIIVLIYSYKVLKESINTMELVGSLFIVGGTLVFGIATVFQPPSDPKLFAPNFIITMIIIGAVFLTFSAYTLKTKRFWGIIFGCIAGSFGGMDNVFKSMSGETSEVDLGAFSGFGSPFIYISFGLGIGAFLLTNYAYTRAKAITVVPAYTAFYIFMPMLLEASFFNLVPGAFQVVGVIICIAGVMLATAFKLAKQCEEITLQEEIEPEE